MLYDNGSLILLLFCTLYFQSIVPCQSQRHLAFHARESIQVTFQRWNQIFTNNYGSLRWNMSYVYYVAGAGAYDLAIQCNSTSGYHNDYVILIVIFILHQYHGYFNSICKKIITIVNKNCYCYTNKSYSRNNKLAYCYLD